MKPPRRFSRWCGRSSRAEGTRGRWIQTGFTKSKRKCFEMLDPRETAFYVTVGLLILTELLRRFRGIDNSIHCGRPVARVSIPPRLRRHPFESDAASGERDPKMAGQKIELISLRSFDFINVTSSTTLDIVMVKSVDVSRWTSAELQVRVHSRNISSGSSAIS